ncbi:MAG: N-acetyltransferase [Desulfovibrio sp.]|jgi:amino-acid N-acetyltransferase|nr:N-acetyltransferase [Desulfovibrio sp.]
MDIIASRAAIRDMKDIHGLLLTAGRDGKLLPRSLSDLYGHVRDFHILRGEDGSLIGCCALALIWEDLGEIRSLYVRVDQRGKGYGAILAKACVREAADMGVSRLFTLTYETGFFSRLGFLEVSKDSLPQKIWADCIHCPKYPDCDETAMLRLLE